MRAQQRRRNGATVLLLASVVAGMAGLSFASVPLYRLFCQATGLGGATQRATTAPAEAAAAVVTIRFDAETAQGLGWEFRPLQGMVSVHPGEERQILYRAVNNTAEPVTGRRLVLVPLSAGHADEMAAVLADPELYAFTGGSPPTRQVLSARYQRWIANSPGDPESGIPADPRGGDVRLLQQLTAEAASA